MDRKMAVYHELDCFHDWAITSINYDADFILIVNLEMSSDVKHILRIVFENVTFLEYQIWDNLKTKYKDIQAINLRMRDSWFVHAFKEKHDILSITNMGGADDFDEPGGQLSLNFNSYQILDNRNRQLTVDKVIDFSTK